jgi:hypothetical protein
VAFERFAQDFHLSFVIANDQPDHQSMDRLREAGRACGYRLRLVRYEASGDGARLAFTNTGVAPLYHDAYPAVGRIRAAGTLRGLCPGERREFVLEGLDNPRAKPTIESDRLVKGQRIGFDADLAGDSFRARDRGARCPSPATIDVARGELRPEPRPSSQSSFPHAAQHPSVLPR